MRMQLASPRIFQKNPRAHKNKIGTPPCPQNQNSPPCPKRGILWTWRFSCTKKAFFQVSIKLAQPFPAPELRTRILRTWAFFWIFKRLARKRQKTRKSRVQKVIRVRCNSSFQGYESSQNTHLTVLWCNQRGSGDPWPISAEFLNHWLPGLLSLS